MRKAKKCIICNEIIAELKREFALAMGRDRICDSCLGRKMREHLFSAGDDFVSELEKMR